MALFLVYVMVSLFPHCCWCGSAWICNHLAAVCWEVGKFLHHCHVFPEAQKTQKLPAVGCCSQTFNILKYLKICSLKVVRHWKWGENSPWTWQPGKKPTASITLKWESSILCTRILTKHNQPVHSFLNFWVSPEGRKLSGGKRAPEQFPSVWQISHSAGRNPLRLEISQPAPLLNSQRLVHVADGPCKQLWLWNVHTIPTCSISKLQRGKTPASRRDNAQA